MPNLPTPPAIKLTNEWQDLYSASGIAVGTQVIVFCRGKHSAFLAESVAEPVGIEGIETYPTRAMYIDEGSPGLWARAAHNDPYTVIVVQVDNVV